MSVGERLLLAFREAHGRDDKQFIASELGFGSVQGVYKVINGERELSFEALERFRVSTKRSIDWLLSGIEEERPTPLFNEAALETLVKKILNEELKARGVPRMARLPIVDANLNELEGPQSDKQARPIPQSGVSGRGRRRAGG